MHEELESIVYYLLMHQKMHLFSERGKEGLTRPEIVELGGELGVWPPIKSPMANWYYQLPTTLRNLESKHLIGKQLSFGVRYFVLSPHEIAERKCKTQ